MLKEVFGQIHAILLIAETNLLANSSLILTVPDIQSGEIQSYEGYVPIIAYRPVTFVQELATGGNQKQKKVAITMPLDIFSPQVGLDFAWREVTDMMIVIDGVMDEFNLRPGLEDASWKALRHLDPDGAVILSNALQDVDVYPQGSTDWRHHFAVDIIVPYFWTCPDNRA